MAKLTAAEIAAIAALKRVAAQWPKSLWLYSACGSLLVMKKKDGKRVMTATGGFDQDYIADAESIKIDNDGGDW